MRLLTPPRTTGPAAGCHTVLPALPPLPAGYAPRISEAPRRITPHQGEAQQEAPRPVPLSGVLRTVTTAAGQDVTVHRADYTRPTEHGGWTLHGYAWRCPTCPAISRGYEATEFGTCLTDARTHICERSPR